MLLISLNSCYFIKKFLRQIYKACELYNGIGTLTKYKMLPQNVAYFTVKVIWGD